MKRICRFPPFPALCEIAFRLLFPDQSFLNVQFLSSSIAGVEDLVKAIHINRVIIDNLY